eukprot:10067169-Ditylum_brightwellii.AAC.1
MFWWAQHMLGLGQSILKNITPIPHLEGSWVNNFRDELNTIKGTLEMQDKWICPIQREHDSHLMQNVAPSRAHFGYSNIRWDRSSS